jgi:hypothetical protein
MKKKIILFSSAILIALSLCGQPETNLNDIIQEKDSLLFSVGFNTCNLAPFYELVSNDCEFYHDQSGFTTSKEDFIAQIEHGLCKLDYKATRELIPGTNQIFPLHSNGKLYGVIQQGQHRFYATYSGKDPYVTSEARFVHLWIINDNNWTLKRVMSFDHRAPE